MPSLCSIPTQRRSLALPSGSSLGTRNSEMPRVPSGAPGVRAQYHPTYYGAYVLDPNGNNIEACCHRPE